MKKETKPENTTENDSVEETTPAAEKEQEKQPKETKKAKKTDKSAELKAELEKTTQELEKQKDLLLRTAAEFDNYKKRTQREALRIGADTRASVIKDLLPALDNFIRVDESDSAADGYKKGVDMSIKMFRDILAKLGLEEIDCVGAEFDPNYHYAVSQVEDENLGDNVVAAVLQRGFKIGENVIRPAMVSVANCK